MKKTYYKWVDGFDAGESSDSFENLEDCKTDMINHTASIRLTKRELNVMQKNCEAFVILNEYEYDDDTDEELLIHDCLDSIDINESTVMIYAN